MCKKTQMLNSFLLTVSALLTLFDDKSSHNTLELISSSLSELQAPETAHDPLVPSRHQEDDPTVSCYLGRRFCLQVCELKVGKH